MSIFITILLKLVALYLSWTCNRNEFLILRIVYAIVAMYFTKIYLIYYLVYHKILRRPCATSYGSGYMI